jgi:hypothetical protein
MRHLRPLFRIFALTAPVLYSATEPEWKSGFTRPRSLNADAFELPSAPVRAERRPALRRVNRAVPAFIMAAAAAIALYFAVPAPMTFEDAIAADNSNAEIANYPSTDSFLGQELMAQSTTVPDPADE